MKAGDLVVSTCNSGAMDHGVLVWISDSHLFGKTDKITTVLFHKAGKQKVMLSSLRKAYPDGD